MIKSLQTGELRKLWEPTQQGELGPKEERMLSSRPMGPSFRSSQKAHSLVAEKGKIAFVMAIGALRLLIRRADE